MNAYAKEIEQAAAYDPIVPARRHVFLLPAQRRVTSRSSLHVETAPGVFHQLCLETGELVGYQARLRHHIKKYVGEDTVLPKMAKHEDALNTAMEVHDRWADCFTYYADRILDLLDFGMDASAVRLLRWLCEGVSGRNIWFGYTHNAQQALGLSRPSLTRAIRALTAAGLVRVAQQGRGKPTRVDIHPWYVFKGDKQVQEQYLFDWVHDSERATHRCSPMGDQI